MRFGILPSVYLVFFLPILIAVLTIWFLDRYKNGVFVKDDKLIPFFMVLGMASLIGIGWELLEFFYDSALGAIRNGSLIAQPSLADTMKDLVNDLLGAILFWLAYSMRWLQSSFRL